MKKKFGWVGCAKLGVKICFWLLSELDKSNPNTEIVCSIMESKNSKKKGEDKVSELQIVQPNQRKVQQPRAT
jgi:hypothetical protein